MDEIQLSKDEMNKLCAAILNVLENNKENALTFNELGKKVNRLFIDDIHKLTEEKNLNLALGELSVINRITFSETKPVPVRIIILSK